MLGGRFSIEREIDRDTLLTRDATRDAPVVVRLVSHPPDAALLAGAAAAVAGIGHGGIAAAIAWGSDGPGGRIWIAYDHDDLPAVAASARTEPWAGPKALAFVGALAESLAALHEVGIVHGSVTDESVLVGAGDVPVIAVPPHAVVGGPLAPELAARAARPTEASDIYGIGTVLWMLLHGAPYVPGTAMDAQIGANHDGATLLAGMLSDDPARRPSSARAVTGRLRSIGLAFGVPLPDPAATMVIAGAPVGSIAPNRPLRGLAAVSGPLLVAAIAVATAGLGAAYLVTHPGGSVDETVPVLPLPVTILPTAPPVETTTETVDTTVTAESTAEQTETTAETTTGSTETGTGTGSTLDETTTTG